MFFNFFVLQSALSFGKYQRRKTIWSWWAVIMSAWKLRVWWIRELKINSIHSLLVSLWIHFPHLFSQRFPSSLLLKRNEQHCHYPPSLFLIVWMCLSAQFVSLPFSVMVYNASMPPLMWSVTWQWSSQEPGYWGRIFTVWEEKRCGTSREVSFMFYVKPSIPVTYKHYVSPGERSGCHQSTKPRMQ